MIKLLILGLLKSGPKHGYAVKQHIEGGGYSYWTDILPNSIYNAFRSLEKNSCIKEHGTEYNGKQSKVLYKITKKGRQEFERLLFSCLSKQENTYPSGLYLALTYLMEMQDDRIMEAIEERRREILHEIKIWENGRKKKTSNAHIAEAMQMIFRNGLSHLRADLALLDYVRDHLASIKHAMYRAKSNGGEKEC